MGCDVVYSFRYIQTVSGVIPPLTPNLTIKKGSASKLLACIYQNIRYHVLDL